MLYILGLVKLESQNAVTNKDRRRYRDPIKENTLDKINKRTCHKHRQPQGSQSLGTPTPGQTNPVHHELPSNEGTSRKSKSQRGTNLHAQVTELNSTQLSPTEVEEKETTHPHSHTTEAHLNDSAPSSTRRITRQTRALTTEPSSIPSTKGSKAMED